MNNEKYVTEKELENIGGESLDGSGFEDETPDNETPESARQDRSGHRPRSNSLKGCWMSAQGNALGNNVGVCKPAAYQPAFKGSAGTVM